MILGSRCFVIHTPLRLMSRGKKSPDTPKIPNTLNMKTLKTDFFFYCLKTIDGQIIFSRCLSEYVLL